MRYKKKKKNTVGWKRVTQTVHRHPGKVSHVHRRALRPTQNSQMHMQALRVAHRKARTQHITGKSEVTKESRQSHSDRTLTHAWTERTNIPTAVRDTACMKTHTHTLQNVDFHLVSPPLIICLSPSAFHPSLSLCIASSHLLTHLLILMKCRIIRIADCRTETGPIGPPNMCMHKQNHQTQTHTHTGACTHTHRVLICPLSSQQSYTKPL